MKAIEADKEIIALVFFLVGQVGRVDLFENLQAQKGEAAAARVVVRTIFRVHIAPRFADGNAEPVHVAEARRFQIEIIAPLL